MNRGTFVTQVFYLLEKRKILCSSLLKYIKTLICENKVDTLVSIYADESRCQHFPN